MALEVKHSIRINMSHIDAAGLIFFPRIYNLCEEALELFFEAAIEERFKDLLYKNKNATVIVHSEADYKKPIRLGDTLEISLKCSRVGKTSFTIDYVFRNEHQEEVAQARTVHVLVDIQTYQKIELSEDWKRRFSQ